MARAYMQVLKRDNFRRDRWGFRSVEAWPNHLAFPTAFMRDTSCMVWVEFDPDACCIRLVGHNGRGLRKWPSNLVSVHLTLLPKKQTRKARA